MGFRKGAEDLRGCESARHGVEYASNAVSWTLQGVGELPRMWNGFRSGKLLRGGGMGLTIGSNYLRRSNE